MWKGNLIGRLQRLETAQPLIPDRLPHSVGNDQGCIIAFLGPACVALKAAVSRLGKRGYQV